MTILMTFSLMPHLWRHPSSICLSILYVALMLWQQQHFPTRPGGDIDQWSFNSKWFERKTEVTTYHID